MLARRRCASARLRSRRFMCFCASGDDLRCAPGAMMTRERSRDLVFMSIIVLRFLISASTARRQQRREHEPRDAIVKAVFEVGSGVVIILRSLATADGRRP